MILRFRPMVAACVRSFAFNLDRVFLTRPLTVSSVTERRSAICLFAFPAAMSRSTSTSPGNVSLVSGSRQPLWNIAATSFAFGCAIPGGSAHKINCNFQLIQSFNYHRINPLPTAIASVTWLGLCASAISRSMTCSANSLPPAARSASTSSHIGNLRHRLDLSSGSFRTPLAGLFLFVPLLDRVDLQAVVTAAPNAPCLGIVAVSVTTAGTIYCHTASTLIAVYYKGQQGTTRNRKARMVALSESVQRDLCSWRPFAIRADGFVFESEAGTPIKYENLWQRYIRPQFAVIGLAWADFRAMRRTNSTLMRAAGADARVSADNRGHGLGVAMEEYTHLTADQKREAVRKLAAIVY
jgi:hypothetical protein